jgi:DNA-binding PadR family transcriptional regulator
MDREHRSDAEQIAALKARAVEGYWNRYAFGGGRGRRRRGDVRQALLMMLAERPLNGYQLMQLIEARSGGRWRPSPGSVYPTLASLEDAGLIRASEHEGSKLYELTAAGRKLLAGQAHGEPPWHGHADHASEADDELRELTHGLHAAISQVARAGDAEQIARAGELLAQTRRGLYRILAEEAGD